MSTLERAGAVGAPASESPATESPDSEGEHASRTRRTPDLGVVFTALFGVFGWAVGLSKLSDISFFWHLRTGESILDHGIPHHDPFSYTAPGTRWVAQSWLAEVLDGTLYRTFGAIGVRLFVGLVGAAIGVLAYRLALHLVRDRVVACGLTIAALAGIYTVWSERPLLIGVAFLLVLLWAVEVPSSFVGRHAVFVIPVLMWLWANTHGTYQLGFAYLGLHLIGRWVDGGRPWEGAQRPLLIGAAVGFFAAFLNPYGVELVTFPIDLLSRGDILSHIVEWKSPDFRATWGIALGIWLAVYALALARGKHRATRRDLIVTLPMLFLALWAVRNVAIAPLICLPVACRAYARDREQSSGASALLVKAAIALLAVVAVVMGAQASTERGFDFATYPVKAMHYVERHDLLGRHLLTTDAAAGYVILQYYPEQKVFIDDRYDMYPRRVIFDYFDLTSAKPGWAKILDRYGVEVIVWPKNSSLAALLESSPAWERVYRDATDSIWVRAGT